MDVVIVDTRYVTEDEKKPKAKQDVFGSSLQNLKTTSLILGQTLKKVAGNKDKKDIL